MTDSSQYKSVDALKRLSDVIVREFPLPIANECNEMLKCRESQSAYGRPAIRQAQMLFEFAIRYATVLLLSEYYAERYFHRRLDGAVDTLIVDVIANPSIEDCFQLMVSISTFLQQNDTSNSLIPELTAYSLSDQLNKARSTYKDIERREEGSRRHLRHRHRAN